MTLHVAHGLLGEARLTLFEDYRGYKWLEVTSD